MRSSLSVVACCMLSLASTVLSPAGTNMAVNSGDWSDSSTWESRFFHAQFVDIGNGFSVTVNQPIKTQDLRLSIIDGGGLTFARGTAFFTTLNLGTTSFFAHDDESSHPGQEASARFSGGRTFFGEIQLSSVGDLETRSTLQVEGDAIVSTRTLDMMHNLASDRGISSVSITGTSTLLVDDLRFNDTATQRIEISQRGSLVLGRTSVTDPSLNGLVRSIDGELASYNYGRITVIANEGVNLSHLVNPPTIKIIRLDSEAGSGGQATIFAMTSLDVSRNISIQEYRDDQGWFPASVVRRYGAATTADATGEIGVFQESGIFRTAATP